MNEAPVVWEELYLAVTDEGAHDKREEKEKNGNRHDEKTPDDGGVVGASFLVDTPPVKTI